MGKQASEILEISYEDLTPYLRSNHSAYMEVEGHLYYLTDCNDIYWRVQDTEKLNEKNHYVDCSDLVPTVSEFFVVAFNEEGDTIKSVFDKATFYASVKE